MKYCRLALLISLVGVLLLPLLPSSPAYADSPVVITDDGIVNADPDIVYCDNGDLLAFYREGTTFDTDQGTIVYKRSTDGGSTWGAAVTVASDVLRDIQMPMVVKTASGRIWFSYVLYNFGVGFLTDSIRVKYSDDNGVTWSVPVQLNSSFTQFDACSGRILEASNGDLIIPIMGQNIGDTFWSSALLRSVDGGATWGGEVLIVDGQAAGRMYAEPWIIETSTNNLVALLRSDNTYPFSIYGSDSTDNGATWSAPTFRFIGNNRPATIKLSDGRLLSTYRRFIRGTTPEGAFMYPAMRMSSDNGTTWGREVYYEPHSSAENFNAGAAPVQVGTGNVSVIYGLSYDSATPKSAVRFTYINDAISSYGYSKVIHPSLDGYLGQGGVNVDWATLTGGLGDSSNNFTLGISVLFSAGNVLDKWSLLRRGIVIFDTSSSGVPAGASITDITLSLYGRNPADGDPKLGELANVFPGLNIYSASPASNVTLADGDYDSLGSTAFSATVPFDDWGYGYNNFVLNATGRAAVSLTGYSIFGVREANYDVANSPPDWTNSKTDFFTFYSSEQGTIYEPELIITYLIPPVATTTASTGVTMSKDGVTGGNFNGAITDLGGGSVNATFQYGLVGAFTGETSIQNKIVGGNFTASMPANLVPGATYQYRAKVVNTVGTGYGDNVTFTFTMPTVTTGTAAQAGNTVTLQGNINSAGVASNSYVYFRYGTTPALGSATTPITQAGTGSFSTTVYAPGSESTLYYQSIARNGVVITTGSVDSIAIPSAVGALIFKTLIRIVLASAIVVGVAVVGSRGGSQAMLLAAIVGLLAFIIVDTMINALF